MNVGDLVRYTDRRFEDADQSYMGIVTRVYFCEPVMKGEPAREMVDVMWDNGMWGEDAYEFEVINEGG